MTSTRLALGAATLIILSAASASAAPAYVPGTVNLRSGAGTSNEIVGKIPGGSLIEAGTCTDGWCEVTWQGKTGFAIQTAIDTSGRVPTRRRVARARVPAGDDYVVVAPPVSYGYYGPAPLYYGGYRPYWRGYGYRPYYRGYYGYRGRWGRRW